MNIKPIYVSVMTAFILSISAGIAVANTDQKFKVSQGSAPEVTKEEAKLPFGEIPNLKQAFVDPAPADRKDGISVGKLGHDGGKQEMILKLAQEIAENKHGRADSLLIAHKGKLLFESYYLRGRVDLPHYQASATKGYLGMAIGRAMQLGYLSMADLDRPVISFLKDLEPSKLAEGAEKITLHKALTMSSGIRLSRKLIREFEQNPERVKGQKQVQTYLEYSPSISYKYESYHYQSIDPQLVMQVLDAVVPGTARDFIKKELLEKMGMTDYVWEENISGLPQAPYGTKMTSRDMLKWGLLVMNEGKWNGEQLIPKAYIAKATNRILRSAVEDMFFVGGRVSNAGYGYYWWQADMKVGDKNYFTTSAQGGGGQYVILIEELDLIVVATGHDHDIKSMQLTADRILPAFVN